MNDESVTAIRKRIWLTHELFLKVSEDLTEEQLAWLPSDTAPPIRWHVWHVARCTDLGATILASTAQLSERPQIWHADRMAEKWGLESHQLGHKELGTRVEPSVSAMLALPSKSDVIDYCRVAIRFLENTVDEFSNDQYEIALADLVLHLSHTNRHLGMIEALRGAMGMIGTATN